MRLTPLARAFIALVIVGVVGYTGWHWYHQNRSAAPPGEAAAGGAPAGAGAGAAGPSGPKTRGKRIIVGVNDFGGAYPGVVANDGAQPGPKSRFSAAGLEVEFKLIRGSKERLAAFDEGEVDVMLLTLDYFANLVPVYRDKGVELRAFLMADWSRGNLGLVVRPELQSIEALRTAKVATTRNTPTHYFLLSLLKKSNLLPAEVERVKSNLVFATKTPLAGEMFKRGEVDAVAIWEPHLSQAMQEGKGHLLVSTATATHLIADVLFARADFLKARQDDLTAFTRIWFEGVAALASEPEPSVQTIARAFGQSAAETHGVLDKIKPTTFADNRQFFGLEREQCAYLSLFDEASRFWQKEGVIRAPAEAGPTRWLRALEVIQKEHATEKVVETFHFGTGPRPGAAALLTKSVSIYFASGDAALGPNARQIVDQFADTLSQFGNAYVRVEGNTDNVGARAGNLALSKKRAAAVVDYLAEHHGLDRARLVAVGNGPDRPVGNNAIEGGREINRRTDFAIIPNN